MSYGTGKTRRLRGYPPVESVVAAGTPELYTGRRVGTTVDSTYLAGLPLVRSELELVRGLGNGRVQITAPTSGRGPMSGYGRPGRPSQLGFAPVVLPIANLVGKIAGGLIRSNKDPERIAAAQQQFNSAMGGSQAAVDWIGQQRHTSGSAVGQAAYEAAWQQLLAVGRITADGRLASQGSVFATALLPVAPKSPALPTTSGMNTDPVSEFFTGLLSTPGGKQVATAALPAVTTAARDQAGQKVGAAIVNNPTVVAGIIVGALALTATLASRGRR